MQDDDSCLSILHAIDFSCILMFSGCITCFDEIGVLASRYVYRRKYVLLMTRYDRRGIN